ncbi:DNA-directed RNA polymerase subunit alpha C-terminal domain-containing protein [Mammaliicoccus lentus]|uniref:DNA-directed RNA polymerase subunit alpha C-terminal domain-containing protein n=1 Tax=Mammaliicoccus lentus TaxID=42858 RepID=UPI003D096287
MNEVEVNELSLSNRSKNQLIKNGYIYVSQLKNLTNDELDNIRNLGVKSIQEIKDFRDNLSSRNEVDIKISEDMPIEYLRHLEIDEIIDDKEILNILKMNNVRVLGVLLDLSYDDISKFRSIEEQTITVVQSLCHQVREKLNLINRDLLTLIIQSPDNTIQEILDKNVPNTQMSLSIKFLYKNNYVSEMDIDGHGFSRKEKKLIITHNLNNLSYLLKHSYSNLLNYKGISKKTLESVLKRIVNYIVVQNKQEYFIGNITRLYLKRSSYYYLLLMTETLLNQVIRQVREGIDDVLKTEEFSINHELDLLLGNHLVRDRIKQIQFNNKEPQELLYVYVKANQNAYSKKEICDVLSNQFQNLNTRKIFDELIEMDLIALNEFDKVFAKKSSILSHIEENYKDNTYKMFKLRLQGKTLEEIGNIAGVTRERVRQVVKKVIDNTNKTFKEDENAYWFNTYDLDNKRYKMLFNDDLYNYLSSRYKKGDRHWTEIIYDDKATLQLKKLIRNEQLKGKIEIDGEIISKTKASIIDYVIKEFGKSPMHLDDLFELVAIFLEEQGLDKNGFKIEYRYLENTLADTSNAVSRGKKIYRYYPYDEYDWDTFYEAINFEEWINLEISTSILFKYHPTLMEKFHIYHENELHNVIKRTRENIKNINIELTRMPNISIGNVDRAQQVKDLMYKHAPLYVEEFAKLYYQTYGVKEQTFKANYLGFIDKYISDDYIKVNFDSVNDKEIKHVEQVINGREFMFIEDLKEKIEDEILDLQIILKHLNYKTFTTYILKSEYETSVNYFNENFYRDSEVVDLTNIDKRLWNLSSFASWLYDKFKTLELIEFAPRKYITRQKLNEIGLTSNILEDFRSETLNRLNDGHVWSIHTIIDVIDNEMIESFGFEPIFYRSILRGLENVYSNKMGGNYLLKKDKEFSIRDLVEEEVVKVKMIDIFDLTEIINEKYDVNFAYYRVIEAVKKTNMYYDEIMEKVYLDINYYYEEFEY